jgi:plasmid stabilization system protein ParE
MTQKKRKQIRWLNAALDDVEQIVAYIAQDRPQAAEKSAEGIFSRVEALAHSPYLGSICPYYRRARQLIHGSYLVYYTVHRKEVVVRAVVHGARLFRSHWLRRED